MLLEWNAPMQVTPQFNIFQLPQKIRSRFWGISWHLLNLQPRLPTSIHVHSTFRPLQGQFPWLKLHSFGHPFTPSSSYSHVLFFETMQDYLFLKVTSNPLILLSVSIPVFLKCILLTLALRSLHLLFLQPGTFLCLLPTEVSLFISSSRVPHWLVPKPPRTKRVIWLGQEPEWGVRRPGS